MTAEMRTTPKIQTCRICGHQGPPEDYEKYHKRLCKKCAAEVQGKRRLAAMTTEQLHAYCEYHSQLIKLAQTELMTR